MERGQSLPGDCVESPEETEHEPTAAALLAAPCVGDVMAAVKRMSARVATWILVLQCVDEEALRLRRDLHEAGHECMMIRADFSDPQKRLQVLAMARDFAGEVRFMWNCTATMPHT